MTHVKLMGELGEKYGSDWHANVRTTRDIFKLIECQHDDFRDYMIDCTKKGINFTVQNGEELLDQMEAFIAPLKDTVIITPVASGAGTSDALKIIVGVIMLWYGASWLMNQGWATSTGTTTTTKTVEIGGQTVEISASVEGSATGLNTYGEIARIGIQSLGVGLAMSGVTGYLTPEGPSEAGKSYLFDGPVNNAKQGIPVPVAYGELIVGGAIMNAGFIEDLITGEQTGYEIVTDGDSPLDSLDELVDEEELARQPFTLNPDNGDAP